MKTAIKQFRGDMFWKALLLFMISLIALWPVSGVVEFGKYVSMFQYEQDSNISFSDSQNYSSLNVRPSETDFGDSNLTVSPEGSADVELDFYDALAGRQDFVSNFTASTDSDQSVNFSISDLPSKDFYEAFFSGSGDRIFIGYADELDDSFEFSASVLNEAISVFNYGEKGVEARGIEFNSTDPVEGNSLKVKTNISNEGKVDSESPGINLTVETFNGTEWVLKENISGSASVPPSGSVFGNLTWMVEPGPWRFNSSLDPEDSIKETNESNNNYSQLLDVDSYQIFYGGSDSNLTLGAEEREIYRWIPDQDRGNIYFYDTDSEITFANLEPIEGSDLDVVDDELKLKGHNDSVRSLWDHDDDGNIDRFRTMNVGGRSLGVPVTNSSENSDFDTGILYDSGDGTAYDGSQDLVFVTEMEPSSQGSFGTYDYEIRVPFSLRELKPGTDLVEFTTELR
jgi:hypothetical protein